MYENGTLTEKEYKKAEKYELIFTNSEKYKGSQVTKDDEGEELSEEEVIKYGKNLFTCGGFDLILCHNSQPPYQMPSLPVFLATVLTIRIITSAMMDLNIFAAVEKE